MCSAGDSNAPARRARASAAASRTSDGLRAGRPHARGGRGVAHAGLRQRAQVTLLAGSRCAARSFPLITLITSTQFRSHSRPQSIQTTAVPITLKNPNE